MTSSNEANSFLANVPDDKKFWSMDGASYAGMIDLSNALKNMKKDVFDHHVSEGKNDFANWVYDVIGDVELANNLRKSRSKNDIAKKVNIRIAQLKKIGQGA